MSVSRSVMHEHEEQRMLAPVRVLVCVVLKPGHTRYYTKGHCLQARGCSAGEPLQGQDWGSMKLIRPLGHSPRQQFLLLIPRDSLQIRTKRDRVCLKVFLSPWSSSTFCFRKTDFISFHFFFFMIANIICLLCLSV